MDESRRCYDEGSFDKRDSSPLSRSSSPTWRGEHFTGYSKIRQRPVHPHTVGNIQEIKIGPDAVPVHPHTPRGEHTFFHISSGSLSGSSPRTWGTRYIRPHSLLVERFIPTHVIEMNPRVSRSSALASKATGFPIAKMAAKLAVGYTLDEIPNDITRLTPACFEPTIDYCVVKIPRWDFEKFKGVDESLGVQMKSVGEAMAFGRTFKEALQKALRSLEQGRSGLGADGKDAFDPQRLSEAERQTWRGRIREQLSRARPENVFYLRYGFQLGLTIEELYDLTSIDPWFLHNIKQIVELESDLRKHTVDGRNGSHRVGSELLKKAKQYGFSDRQLAHLWASDEAAVRTLRKNLGILPVFKTVDTCAAEFAADTPYHYSTYETENESHRSDKRKVIILGGGPNRIGQGIEFDYCCVHGVMGLEEEGYETIMVNCNPETVSTDYDTTGKLYFEPLTLEDVLNICEHENPVGVIVAFGGQTPLKIAKALELNGVRILGTSSDFFFVSFLFIVFVLFVY